MSSTRCAPGEARKCPSEGDADIARTGDQSSTLLPSSTTPSAENPYRPGCGGLRCTNTASVLTLAASSAVRRAGATARLSRSAKILTMGPGLHQTAPGRSTGQGCCRLRPRSSPTQDRPVPVPFLKRPVAAPCDVMMVVPVSPRCCPFRALDDSINTPRTFPLLRDDSPALYHYTLLRRKAKYPCVPAPPRTLKFFGGLPPTQKPPTFPLMRLWSTNASQTPPSQHVHVDRARFLPEDRPKTTSPTSAGLGSTPSTWSNC